MSHVDLDAMAVPVKVFADLAANVLAVDIAVDGSDGLKIPKPAEDAGSEVTSVPDFVTFSEVPEDRIVEKAVGVGHEANAHASGMIACAERLLSWVASKVFRFDLTHVRRSFRNTQADPTRIAFHRQPAIVCLRFVI
jgi:hypothetical protein